MLPQEKCTGCSACASVCPKQCIEMTPDREGFLRPQIFMDRCIRCGLCERICPVMNEITAQDQMPMAFAVKNNDLDCRTQSSSGGVFSALALHAIEEGGAVFGAAVSRDNRVEHICVETPEEITRLRGSKYVSSFLGDTFLQIRENLQTGRTVLFSGTPCQVEGLLSFLKRPYGNLLTVDLICHGVPSAKVWEKYLKYQEQQNHAGVEAVGFRSKDTGWKHFSMKLSFTNGTTYSAPMREDPYLHAFLDNLCLRPSCHDCAFKTVHRRSDLTLADFWGIQNIHPEEDDDWGTSLVLAHSTKGLEALDRIRDRLSIRQTDPQTAIRHNSAMVKSVEPHHFRQYFFHQLGKQRFDTLVEDCFHPSYAVRVRRKLLMKATAFLQRKRT